MAKNYIYIAETEEEVGAANAYSGRRNLAGKLYYKGNEPAGAWPIKVACCPLDARQYRLGLSIDEYNVQMRKLKYGQVEFI